MVTTGELNQARRATTVFMWLVFVLGLVGALVRYTDAPPAVVEVGGIIAATCIPAFLTAFIINRFVNAEAWLRQQHLVENSIAQSLQVVRSVIQEGAQADYRWNCILSSGPPEFPQGYALQKIEIFKRVSALQPIYQIVCLAAESHPALRGDFLARWEIDSALGDPHDFFRLRHMEIEGIRIDPEMTPWEGTAGILATYRVPEMLRQFPRSSFGLAYGWSAPKFVGTDSRIRIRTQVFATTNGAEFRCTLTPDLGAKKFYTASSEVSQLGPGATAADSRADLTEVGPWSLVLRYETPLAAGSAVAFHIER